MKWSSKQTNFFDAVKNTKNNIALLATAGSGKTTTILEALNFLSRTERTIFLSFSNAIVKELTKRVPPHIKASTLHSLGFNLIKQYTRKKITVVEGGNKYFQFALNDMKGTRDQLTKKEFRSCFLVQDVCAYARQTLTNFNDETALKEMCNYYNIDWDQDIIELSMKMLNKHALNTKASVIDFIDMIYWPAMIPDMCGIKYDNVFLDEAQDTNKCQLKLIENILKKDSRLISVGDDYQCIYGFSGADIDAFKRIRERPNTVTLPLSVTYRCPKSHVEKAKEICHEMEAFEEAKDGVLRNGHWTEIEHGDMVLSRTTKPLIALFFGLIDKGVSAHIVGKDIENGLLTLAESLYSTSMAGILVNMETKLTEKFEELLLDGVKFPKDHPQFYNLLEKTEVLKLIMKKVDSPKDITTKIKQMFHSDTKGAQLMTIHRSKGLEAERVFVLEQFEGQSLMPSKYARQAWEHSQENNLIFVAQTRSKNELIFLTLNDL